MKAILEFDLNDADDQMAHLRCVKATELALVLWEFYYNTKKGIAYKMQDNPKLDGYDVLDLVFERL
jgi:hypothetical protein